MNDQNDTQNHAPATNRRAAVNTTLTLSAAALTGLIMLQASGLMSTPAHAEMAVKTGDFTAMTTGVAGDREILFIIDDDTETLMVVSTEQNNRTLNLRAAESLPSLFSAAAAGSR